MWIALITRWNGTSFVSRRPRGQPGRFLRSLSKVSLAGLQVGIEYI